MGFSPDFEASAMAQGLPSHDLTADSRVSNHCMKDWHRFDKDQFDRGLDFLWNEELLAKDTRAKNPTGKHQLLDWSMETPDQATHTHVGADITVIGPNMSSSNVTTGAKNPSPVTEFAGNELSHISNEFDKSEYQMQASGTGEQNSLPMAQAYSSSSSEPIGEQAASIGINPSSLTATPMVQYQAQLAPKHHQPMQRGLTDSNISYTNWGTNSSHGLPNSTGAYFQTGDGHQNSHSNIQKASNASMNPYGRSRAHTNDYFPASHYDQTNPSYYGSSVRHPTPTNGYGNQNELIYAPAHHGVGLHYHPIENGESELGSTSFRSSNPYSVHSATPNSSYSDAHNFPNNIYVNVLPTNSMHGHINNRRHVANSNNHHINSGQIVDSTHLQIDQACHLPPQLQPVPPAQILKSNNSYNSDATRSTPMSSKRKLRVAAKQQRPRETDLADEEDENIDQADDQEPDVNYPTIEAARAAERPRFRTNPSKDETIPRTDREKQLLVARMVRCMRATKKAEDNDGMIKQWVKLKQDGPRVEQAAWRILELVLQIHVDGVPLLPNKPSCNRYAKMRDRWDAICEGLYYQKTMCKHLLGAEFTSQLVNDPATAMIRVQNNRKVNAGKKTWLEQGRRVSHDETGKATRAGSSLSMDDDSFLSRLGEVDADGDVDDEYSGLHQHINTSHTQVPQITPTPPSTRSRSFKRELDAEESDYGATLGKKRPRQTQPGTRRGSNKGSTKGNTKSNAIPGMRQPRPPGKISKYQAINGVMINIEDKDHEDLVYRDASPDVQAKFTKVHYPNGRPSTSNRLSENNESRRITRASAPTTFRGADNSDEIANGESGSPDEATDGDYHNGNHRQQ